MSFFSGFAVAFSLFSTLPMPKMNWTKKNMRYAMCFFPLVGATVAVFELLWYILATNNNISVMFFALVATIIPIVITGAIHLDGFMDTWDAISTHADKEKKLLVLKDPHVGAFGVTACVFNILAKFVLWTQVYQYPALIAIPIGSYIISRAYNALSIILFTPAKTSGIVYSFSVASDKFACKVVGIFYVVIFAAVIVSISALWGIVFNLLAVLYFWYHMHFCYSRFGGNSGDLAGFLLENIELLALIMAAVGGVMA